MKTAISLRMELSRRHAEALSEHLRRELRHGIQEHWYADEFRLVAEGHRTAAILAAYPAIAAQKKALGALTAAMNQQA